MTINPDMSPFDKFNFLASMALELGATIKKEWDGEKMVLTITVYR